MLGITNVFIALHALPPIPHALCPTPLRLAFVVALASLASELTNIRNSQERKGEEVAAPPELGNPTPLKASSALEMLVPPQATVAAEM